MRDKILRTAIVAGLLVILLQIWLIPNDPQYIDFLLVEPGNDQYQIANSVKVKNNETEIYPFLRNVMGRTILLQLQVEGLNHLEENSTKMSKIVQLEPHKSWVLENDKPANSENFDSSWEIFPMPVLQIEAWMHYLNISLQYYNYDWENYSWVTIQLIQI